MGVPYKMVGECIHKCLGYSLGLIWDWEIIFEFIFVFAHCRLSSVLPVNSGTGFSWWRWAEWRYYRLVSCPPTWIVGRPCIDSPPSARTADPWRGARYSTGTLLEGVCWLGEEPIIKQGLRWSTTPSGSRVKSLCWPYNFIFSHICIPFTFSLVWIKFEKKAPLHPWLCYIQRSIHTIAARLGPGVSDAELPDGGHVSVVTAPALALLGAFQSLAKPLLQCLLPPLTNTTPIAVQRLPLLLTQTALAQNNMKVSRFT